MATANEEKQYRMQYRMKKSDGSPENQPHYCNVDEPVYHTLDKDTVSESITIPHASVAPSMSKAEHVYHTLDDPKQSKHKYGMDATSLATHALTVPNTTKPKHIYHTLQNLNQHERGVESETAEFAVSKEALNSQNRTSDTDPKYDEPIICHFEKSHTQFHPLQPKLETKLFSMTL